MNRPARGAEPVLLVEDKDSLRTMLRLALEGQGYLVVEARDEAEARAALGKALARPRAVRPALPVGDGFGVLRAAKDADPDLPVIVMTAYGGIEDAVRAMKEGALDFLAKPVDPEHLLLLVERALEQRRLADREQPAARRKLAEAARAARTSSASPSHPEARCRPCSVRRRSETTVLIEGESGTGKELVRARAPRAQPTRRTGPFVAINCAAIPETLLETELFGYEKGAFTGAAQRKPGKFELAHRGTLFLDEIGDLPLAAAGQDAARARGATLRTRWRDDDHPGGRARRGRDEP